MTDFSDLIRAVRESDGPSRDLDLQIWQCFYPDKPESVPFFTDDPRAAASLVPRCIFLVERKAADFKATVILKSGLTIEASHSRRFLAACLAGLMAAAHTVTASSSACKTVH